MSARPRKTGGSAGKRKKRRISAPAVLKKGDACGAWVAVGECSGGVDDICQAEIYEPAPKKGRGEKQVRKQKSIAPSVVGAFAAAGHPVRARLLQLMLRGAVTYAEMKKATRQEAGPLYHHVNQLRMSGLLRPKQRDCYELTRGGRNLILLMMAAAPLARDKRRRAQSSATSKGDR